MTEADLRVQVAQRYEFIEWRAYWTGRVNRKDLEAQFQISTPQASVDLRQYQEAAPDNIVYDASEKAYLPTANFRPVFLRLSPERYLLQLQAIKSGAVRKSDTWFDGLPNVEVTPSAVHIPHAPTVRAVVNAIRTRSSIEVYYQSLTRTGMRTICPHALAHDGFRWHCRAFAVERGEFRDYVIGRILSFSQPKLSSIDPADDIEWTTQIALKIRAHPRLDSRQRAVIEHDYEMKDGKLEIVMRLPTAFYFVRRHNLDLLDKDIDPVRLQLCIDNLDELNAAAKAAKEQARVLIAHRRRTCS